MVSDRLGKQLGERRTTFGDKLEIYLYKASPKSPDEFVFVVNDLSQFTCISWKEAEDLYEHFYSSAIA